MDKNWFKIGILILVVILIYIVSINLSQNRKADILKFCVKQYDDNAVGVSANTWFDDPNNCLGRFNELIKN